MLVATQLAVTYLGRAGVNTLAAIMGVTDVDPFIMGMTQAAGALTPLKVAAAAVLIAAASNNLRERDLRLQPGRPEDRCTEPLRSWRLWPRSVSFPYFGWDREC